MMKHIAATFLLVTVAGTGVARADDDCHVPMNQWQPREAVQTMATSRGWTVTRIKIDDGCYEVRGSDETGKAFKAKIDPATLAIVKMKQRDRDHDRDHDRDDGRRGSKRGEGQQPGAAAPSNAPSNPLFDQNSRPKVIVK
ncbi:hypothetical protein FHS76_002959 [Ochrobactrum daejeonense]|uniref:PepSY domain-containing protein n=1 Tax=Brucella daejeonensis TaxID=659015 RepID=A0A7W9EM43_9HYPH|nr:PepSY domain-containing protein [Brucella daejeonensis]MBB5703063.1 hypothetical protein [Brucella daejeonensis]NKB79259.1 PepSY domain-containing protein [Brucella daejeonensis]